MVRLIRLRDILIARIGWLRYILGRSLAAAVGLATTFLLPQLLQVNVLGWYYSAVSFILYIGVLARFGGEYVLFRRASLSHGVDTDAQPSFILGQALAPLIVNGLGLFAVTFVVIALVTQFSLAQVPSYFPLGLVWIFIASVLSSISVYLYQASKADGLLLFSSLVKTFFINTFFVILVFFQARLFGSVSPDDVLQLYVVAAAAAALFSIIFYTRKNFRSFIRGFRDLDVSYWRAETRTSFVYSATFVLFTEIEIWLATLFLNPSDVAVYGTARRLVLAGAIFIDLSNVLFPKVIGRAIAENDFRGMERRLSRESSALAAVAATIALIALVAGRALIGLLLPPDYAEVAILLPILLISPVITLLLGPSEILLLIWPRSNARMALARYLVLASAIQLALAPLLTAKYGMIGLAISSVAANAALRILLLSYVRRRLDINLIYWSAR